MKAYRQAWIDAGHPGDPTTVVRIPTLVADTKEEADRQTENLMNLARRYYAGRIAIGSTDAGTRASPEATEEVNLFGTPEEVCDKIEMLRDDFSTDEIMFEVETGRPSSVPREVVMNTMRCLTDKVIPAQVQVIARRRNRGQVCRAFCNYLAIPKPYQSPKGA